MKSGKAKVLTKAEFKRVLAVASSGRHSKRNVAMIYVSFALGLRGKEMASLKLKHVINMDNKDEIELLEEINLEKSMTKGNKQRYVFLINKKLRKSILEYAEERKKNLKKFTKESPLFLSQKGDHFSSINIRKIFKRLYDESGIKGASSHSGRRTFATNLIEKGNDIKAVSTLMGHSSISMTSEYVANNPERLKKICSDSLF